MISDFIIFSIIHYISNQVNSCCLKYFKILYISHNIYHRDTKRIIYFPFQILSSLILYQFISQLSNSWWYEKLWSWPVTYRHAISITQTRKYVELLHCVYFLYIHKFIEHLWMNCSDIASEKMEVWPAT